MEYKTWRRINRQPSDRFKNHRGHLENQLLNTLHKLKEKMSCEENSTAHPDEPHSIDASIDATRFRRACASLATASNSGCRTAPIITTGSTSETSVK